MSQTRRYLRFLWWFSPFCVAFLLPWHSGGPFLVVMIEGHHSPVIEITEASPQVGYEICLLYAVRHLSIDFYNYLLIEYRSNGNKYIIFSIILNMCTVYLTTFINSFKPTGYTMTCIRRIF